MITGPAILLMAVSMKTVLCHKITMPPWILSSSKEKFHVAVYRVYPSQRTFSMWSIARTRPVTSYLACTRCVISRWRVISHSNIIIQIHTKMLRTSVVSHKLYEELPVRRSGTFTMTFPWQGRGHELSEHPCSREASKLKIENFWQLTDNSWGECHVVLV